MKILIVDDDNGYRRLLQIFLSAYGTCTTVKNGFEAIESVKCSFQEEDRYDLISLDYLMPVMDGMETLEAIRKLEKENEITWAKRTKIIMSTTVAKPMETVKALNLGCDSYLIKDGCMDAILDEMQYLGLLTTCSE